MSQPKIYANSAERMRAYRLRLKAKRNASLPETSEMEQSVTLFPVNAGNGYKVPVELQAKVDQRVSCVSNGDATQWIHKAPKFDLLLTDPPYGIGLQMNRGKVAKKRIAGDNGLDQALTLFTCVMQGAFARAKTNATVMVFADRRYEYLFRQVLTGIGFTYRDTYVYIRNNHGTGDTQGTFSPQYESLIHCVKGKPKLTGSRPSSVLQGDTLLDSSHPTRKPVDMLQRIIKATTPTGGVVLDPFAGSGSTLVAAYRENRLGYGCELDTEYFIDIQRALRKDIAIGLA